MGSKAVVAKSKDMALLKRACEKLDVARNRLRVACEGDFPDEVIGACQDGNFWVQSVKIHWHNSHNLIATR